MLQLLLLLLLPLLLLLLLLLLVVCVLYHVLFYVVLFRLRKVLLDYGFEWLDTTVLFMSFCYPARRMKRRNEMESLTDQRSSGQDDGYHVWVRSGDNHWQSDMNQKLDKVSFPAMQIIHSLFFLLSSAFYSKRIFSGGITNSASVPGYGL